MKYCCFWDWRLQLLLSLGLRVTPARKRYTHRCFERRVLSKAPVRIEAHYVQDRAGNASSSSADTNYDMDCFHPLGNTFQGPVPRPFRVHFCHRMKHEGLSLRYEPELCA